MLHGWAFHTGICGGCGRYSGFGKPPGLPELAASAAATGEAQPTVSPGAIPPTSSAYLTEDAHRDHANPTSVFDAGFHHT